MRVGKTKHGLRLFRDDRAPIDVMVVYDDEQTDTCLLIGTEHDAVEVWVTPEGRSVAAADTELRPRKPLLSEED
jgi:hypothetical protein